MVTRTQGASEALIGSLLEVSRTASALIALRTIAYPELAFPALVYHCIWFATAERHCK